MLLLTLRHHKAFLHLVAFEKMRFFAASPCKLHLGVVVFSFQGDCERTRVCPHVPLMWQAYTYAFYIASKTCLFPQQMTTTISVSGLMFKIVTVFETIRV